MLQKKGEPRRYSVGFCRLARCNIAAVRLLPLANRRAFNQVESFLWNNHRWHPVCSLIVHLQDWLPGVAGTDPRLGNRFGASITKRGLAPAPFSFRGACLAADPFNLLESHPSVR